MDTKAQDLKLSQPMMCTPHRLTNQEKELFRSQFNENANEPEAEILIT